MRRGTPWKGKASSLSSSNHIGAGPSRRQHAHHEIYDDLLQEALRESPRTGNERPLKKRRSRRDPSEVIVIDDSTSGLEDFGPQKRQEREVVVIESSRESTDGEDEMEWDNVDLNALPTSEDIDEPKPVTDVREVTINSTPQKSLYLSLLYVLIIQGRKSPLELHVRLFHVTYD
jgi:hypothetical protein